jgi:hypothetical protein
MTQRRPTRSNVLAMTWFVVTLSLSCVASADDPDAVVRFVCDKNARSLSISQDWEEALVNAPYPRKINAADTKISVRGLMWATESAAGVITWHSKPVRRSCRLGNDAYTATLAGYRVNPNPQGQCGAGSPTLRLTLVRGSQLLAKDLIFDHACSGMSPHVLRSIRIDARNRHLVTAVVNDTTEHDKELRVSVDTPITRQRLFGEE